MNPYDELGVSTSATADDLRKAWRRLASKLHPDRNPGDKEAEERFKRCKAAYDVLSDPDKRRAYDETGQWTEPVADNSLTITLRWLTEIMIAVLIDMSSSGVSAKGENVVERMKAEVTDRINKQKHTLNVMRRVVAGLNEMKTRAKHTDGGENLLAKIAEDQRLKTEKDIQEGERYILSLNGVSKFLAKYGYVIDKPETFTSYFSGFQFGNFGSMWEPVADVKKAAAAKIKSKQPRALPPGGNPAE